MRLVVVLALVGLSGCLIKKPPEPAVPSATGTDSTATDGGTTASTGSATGTTAGTAAVLPAALTEEQKAIARREKAKEATALLTTGEFEDSRRALTLLKELQTDLPESPTVAYNLGLAQEQLGNRAMAEQAYRQATQLQPDLGAAWLRLGALAEAGGDLSWASQVYGQGMRAAPEDMDLHVASIGILVRQGRLDEAEASAKQALGINANAQAIYANLALIYIKQDKLELGKFIINRAFNFVDGAKDNAHLHAYLGRIFYLQEHPFEARASYEKALELDPELLDAMIFLSEVHLDNRAYGAMVPLLERAVEVAPDDPAIHMNLGIGYRGTGRFEEAEKEYRRVIELEPGHPEPYLNLVILYGDHQKKYDEAMALLEQYRGMNGADPTIADAWGEQYEKEKERAVRAAARRARADERRRKKEEEQRFLEEFERKKQEEEERQRQLEAEQAAQGGSTEAAPGSDTAPGTEAAPDAAPGTDAAPDGETPTDAAPATDAAPGADAAPDAAPGGTDAAPAGQPATGAGAEAATGEPAASEPAASESAAVEPAASEPASVSEPPAEPAADGTAPAEPVSQPEDSTPEPAAPSEPSPGASAEDAAGQPGEGAEPTSEESTTPESP